MKKILRATLLTLFLMTLNVWTGSAHTSASCSVPRDSTRNTLSTHRIGINARGAWLMPTHKFFRGENGTGKPLNYSASAHLQYSYQFPASSTFGTLFPTAYQGIGVGWNTFFDKKEIGMPTAVYIFQGAQICRLASRLSLDYEWNFGASFGWKPFHDDEELDGRANIYNTVVGSKVNAYINASLILTYRPVNQATLFFGVDVSHFSNGNTRYPNAGVNTLGIKVGGTYGFGECSMRKPGAKLSRKADYGFSDIWSGTRPYCSIPDEREENRFINRMSLNVTLYGALRSKGLMYEDNAYILGNKFAVAGIDLSPMYRVGKCFAAGLSVDLQYDESANLRSHIAGTDHTEDGIKLLVRRPPLRESLAAGLSLRAELIMPIFMVGVGVGHNIIYNGSDFDGFYQVFNLKTSLTKRLFLNIGYKLTDLKRPNNLMIGLGWSFHRIRTK